MFDILKESIKGSVAASGTVAAELSGKLKTSIDDSLKQLPQLFEELSNMTSQMVTELWNNCKGAVGYVTENT